MVAMTLRGDRRWLASPLLAGLLWLWGVSTVQAQLDDRTTPTRAYFAGVAMFNEGDYKDALDIFLAEGRGAIKTSQSRWIDSICYHTMCGECFYQMGDLGKALEHYTSALELFVTFSDWLNRVQFRPLRPASPGAVKAVPWGASARRARVAYFSDSTLMSQGQIDNNAPFQRGGIVQQAVMFPVNVQEIVRTTCLALRRRAELLGPISMVDPLTGSVLSALSRRPGPPNHWSEAWIDLELGLAYAAAGRDGQALPLLNRAIVAAGEYDHPMTCTALVQLGIMALRQGNYTAASKYLDEATYAAVNFGDVGVLEEAFRYGMIAHLMANRSGVFPPLATAVTWGKVKGTRRLHATLAALAAENCALRGQAGDAQRLLDEARLAIGRRTMGRGALGARMSFIAALVAYEQRRIAEGDAALSNAMAFMRGGSLWVFQIAMADNLYVSGARYITSRTALELYRILLRDPLAADWAIDPMESMAVLVTPHPGPYERWLEVAMSRKEFETALEIADRLRRHRFFSSLAMGGRLQSLRWVLGASTDALDQRSQLLRRDLMVRYPLYDQLEQQAKKIREQLATQPLVAETPDLLRQQSQILEQWGAISLRQEALLRELAVRREPAGLVFPPLCNTVAIQKALPNKRAILAFLITSRRMYAFLLNNQRYSYWEVSSPALLYRRIVELLRQMGHFEQNRELPLKELANEQWKVAAQQVLELLLKGSQADLSQPLDELVIVPDGFLWYLPFEALQVKVDGKLVPLLSRFRIRYAPTLSLTLPDGRGHKPTARTAVVVGNLFGRDTEPLARAASEQLAKVLPGTTALKTPLPAPSSIYAGLFDRLVVLDEVTPTENPYGWAPLVLDRGKAGSTLNDWLALPWQGPEEIVLPGFHTAAESALKRAYASGAGHEVFLSVCGLMASGARTVLLSRWRTGGQTSCDLMREFAQELPHTEPSEAWQRAVFLVANSQLNLEAEPRIKSSAGEEVPKATHPFFWGGYLLVDTGAAAQRPDSQEEAAPAKPEDNGAALKGPGKGLDNAAGAMPGADKGPGAKAGAKNRTKSDAARKRRL